MSRFTKAVVHTVQGLMLAVTRFPLTVICLLSATGITFYMISLNTTPSLFIQKLLFTFGLGAFLSVTTQFFCERFPRLQKMRWFIYLIAVLLIVGYYLILAAAPNIDYAVNARTAVAVFAMFCIFIWLPSYKGKTMAFSIAEFNNVALTHFKAIITSALFSAVLSAGVASIIATVDALLFAVDDNAYGYAMAIIWILFATIFYLSRLPRFHSEKEEDAVFTLHAASYPKVLKILISYIVIPLIGIYSLVLIAYFLKILFTFVWPSGQLAPMILAYSTVGLIVFVLASHLEDKFAATYRKLFPKVLILMVVMQLFSVYLRVQAYGVTESRYYLILFGIYSLVCAIILSIRPVKRNFMIALLGAAFAVISILPPMDAFTVSRNSQINRLEQMLITDGVLVDGKIIPKANASLELRQETTNILNYLERRHYLQYVVWLPEEIKSAESEPYIYLAEGKMEDVFGFGPAYPGAVIDNQYFYAGLDMQKPVDISGYDVFVGIGSYRYMPKEKQPIATDVTIDGKNYVISAERLTPQEVRVSVKDGNGTEVVGTDLYEFAQALSAVGSEPKESLSPDSMSINVEENGYQLKVIFQSINITFGGGDAGADYDLLILFGVASDNAVK